jgi:hypothetical protein
MDESQRKVRIDQPSSLLYERKFDTAIRQSTLNELNIRISTSKTTEDDDFLLITTDPVLSLDPVKIDPHLNLYAIILTDLLGRVNNVPHNTPWLGRTLNLIGKNVEIQLAAAEMSIEPSLRPLLRPLVAHAKLCGMKSPLINMIAEFAHELSGCIELLGKTSAITRKKQLSRVDKLHAVTNQNLWCANRYPLKIRWSGRLAKIEWNNVCYVVPRSYILLIHNKLADLISVLLYAHSAAGVCLEPEAGLITELMVRELTVMANDHGENFFAIAKCLEGLVAAETLLDSDSWRNDGFLNAISDDLWTNTGYIYAQSTLQRYLRRSSIPLRHELGCMGKMLGHPYVDMELGVKKLKEATRMELNIDRSYLLDTIRYSKQEFIASFLLRHRRWPNVRWIGEAASSPKGLLYANLNNLDPNSAEVRQRYGAILLRDYDYFDLGPELLYADIENVIPHLKDKTISVLRSKVYSWYIHRHEDDTAPKWVQTRQLLYYLLAHDEILPHKIYMSRYLRSRSLAEIHEYLVLRIVPKEKELKVDFRGFGCKTYEDRLRGVSQEVNVKHFLDLYSDEQVMTLSELEICRKLNAVRNILKAYVGYRVLYINIDASKWNNRFRDALVRPVMAATLDKIFNRPIFSRTQEAFQNTLFYVPDESGTQFWEGQEGGIEGLNQDTWVSIYISMIKATLRDETYKIHVLCKGDDLRVIILIPPKELEVTTLESIRQRIVTKISQRALLLGHKIKVEDSYGSENYFCFSKAASLGPVELPSVFRKIQKTYGANNAFLPFLDEMVGSAYSNAHSACRVGVECLGPYCVALFWVFYHLTTIDYYKNLADDALVCLSLIPSLFGGFPTIYYSNMHVRAESDLLTPFLQIYQTCQLRFHRVARYMDNWLKIHFERGKDYFDGLLSDPYSLALTKPRLPATIFRQSIRPVIISKVRNPEVEKLLSSAGSASMRNLKRCLQSANIYNPKIISAVYSASPDGLVQELTRKFESARSIFELVVTARTMKGAERLLRGTIRAESSLQRWRCRVLQGSHPHNVNLHMYYDQCPTKWADAIRAGLWGRPVEGVTTPPLYHQVLLTTPHLSSRNPWCVQNAFTYEMVLPRTIVPNSCPLYAASERMPFLGYTTRSGTTAPTISMVEKDLLLAKVKNLIELADWTDVSGYSAANPSKLLISNMPDVILKTVGLYLPVDVATLAPFTGKHKAGTIQHHVRAPKFRESIVPNTLSNVYTLIKGESNTHLRLNDSRQHYYLNFLHILCHLTSIISEFMLFNPQIPLPRTYWGVTSECAYCNRPISETPIVMDPALIGQIVFHPISATTIPGKSMDILQQSLEKAQGRVLLVPENLDYITDASACKALLQEVASVSVTQRQRLLDRYAHHSVTREGQSILQAIATKTTARDVGMSELVRIPTPEICTWLKEYIAFHALEGARWLSADTFARRMIEVPSSDLPWAPLFYALHKNLRLHDVVVYISHLTRSPIPRCAESPAAAASLCASLLFELFVTDSEPIAITRLSRYQSQDLSPLLQRASVCTRAKAISALHQKVFKAEKLQEIAPEDLVALLIMYHAPIPTLEDLVNYSLTLQPGEVHNIQAWILDDWDLESCWLILENPQTLDPDFDGYMRETPQYQWIKAFESLELDPNGVYTAAINVVIRAYFTLVVAELNTCIIKVRKLPPVTTSIRNVAVVNQSPTPDLILDSNDHYLLWTEPSVEVETSSKFPDAQCLTYEDLPVRLYQYNARRIFTTGNTSVSRLVWILGRLISPTQLAQPVTALCLADGHGGFSSAFSSCGTGSHVIFSTLTRNLEHPPDALYAQDCARKHGNTINTSLGGAGLGDLTSEATVTATVDHIRHQVHPTTELGFVTCDMDPIESLTTTQGRLNYIQALHNVGRIFLEVATEETILICKVILKDTCGLSTLLACLANRCRMLSVLSNPTSATCNAEVYVVAQGPAPKDISITPQFLAGSWMRYPREIQAEVQKQIETELQTDRIYISEVWPLDLIRHWDDRLPSTFVSRVFNEHQLNMTDVLKRAYSSPYIDMFKGDHPILQEIGRRFEIHGDGYLNATIRGHQIARLAPHLNLDTRAHILYMYQKAIQCFGAVDICYLLIHQTNRRFIPQSVSNQELFRMFVRRVTDPDGPWRRLYWDRNPDSYQLRTPPGENKLDRPYMHYLFGVRYIVYLLAGHSHFESYFDDDDF